MKSLFVAVLLLAGIAGAQSFKGGVAAFRIVPPNVAASFLLFGELEIGANQFSYSDGDFSLSYTSPAPSLCANGCTFSGTYREIHQPVVVGDGCADARGEIQNGVLTMGSQMFSARRSRFRQTYCQYGDNHFWVGGQLVVIIGGAQ